MNRIETRARRMAAAKMGLIQNPTGERLPDDLWRQCLPQATVEQLQIECAEALGHVLGMIDVVIMAKDIPDFFDVAEKIEHLRARRAEYEAADKAYRDARAAQLSEPF